MLQLLHSPSPKLPSCWVRRGAEAHVIVGSLPTTPWFLKAVAPRSSSCLPSPLCWSRYLWTSRYCPRIPMFRCVGGERQGPTPKESPSRPCHPTRCCSSGLVQLTSILTNFPASSKEASSVTGAPINPCPRKASASRPRAASGRPPRPKTPKNPESPVQASSRCDDSCHSQNQQFARISLHWVHSWTFRGTFITC